LSHENPRLVSISDAQRWKLKISAFLKKKSKKEERRCFLFSSSFVSFPLFSCLLPELHCYCFSFFGMCAAVRARRRLPAHHPPSISQKQKWINVFFFILWA
jgi:hypothetical protein